MTGNFLYIPHTFYSLLFEPIDYVIDEEKILSLAIKLAKYIYLSQVHLCSYQILILKIVIKKSIKFKKIQKNSQFISLT